MKGFRYTMLARPTTVNGVTYRSMLEARWGVFLELRGWSPEYEPCDLGDWVPDFRIECYVPRHLHYTFEGRAGVLVEVKPIRTVDIYDESHCALAGNTCDLWDEHKPTRTEDTCWLVGETPDYVWHFHKGALEQHPIYGWGTAWNRACAVTQWRPAR